MAGDGAAALGAPEIAGTMVNPRGLAKKTIMRTTGAELGGMVGSLVATGVGGRRQRTSDLPSFGRVGYLAASDAEVALVKCKSGAFKMHVTDQALARAPRSELEAVEFDEGRLISHLKLSFAGGTEWEFEVPKMGKKSARALVDALGGTVT